MVISNLFLKKDRCAAIALMVIAILFLGNTSIAEAKIDDAQLKQIKTILEITNFPFSSDYSEEQLKEILNKALKPDKPDITYGILILSSWSEIEFMDMVLSQGYKKPAKDYFNKILDTKLNLANNLKGVGQDIYKVVTRGGITVNPVFALTLNTFSMTNKIVEIFITFEGLSRIKKYNGLWSYFDQRRYNTSHEQAWSDAKDIMGWAAYSYGGFYKEGKREENLRKLETQFANLWDKWGPYATPFGLSEEAKTQVKNELNNTFASAAESYEPKPGLAKTIKEVWGNLISQLQSIENNIKELSQEIKINAQNALNKIQSALSEFADFYPAAVVQEQTLGEGITELLTVQQTEGGILSESIQQDSPAKPGLAEMQEELDDLLELADVVDQKVTELLGEEISQEESLEVEENELGEDPAENNEEEIIEEDAIQDEEAEGNEAVEARFQQTEEVVLCEKIGAPAKNKVIINEIAWMGTENSGNDEWIELKNISNGPINLAGWQLLDKDDQIKIIFGEEIIEANHLFLLERTDDSSLPDISADLIYTGSLSNSNEILYLFDENCQLQEQVGSLIDWPFGDNSSKRTMERKDNLDWQISLNPGGTPKDENSSGYTPPTSAGGGGGAPSSPPAQEAEEVSVLPPEILITEVQIKTASSNDYDFIEFYNPTTDSTDISGLQLKKKTSTGNDYSVRVFPENSSIAALSYFLWANSNYASSTQIAAGATSSQTLAQNNSIALLSSDGEVIDAVAWGTSTNPFVEGSPFADNPEEGQSLGRKWSTTTENYIDSDNNSEDFEVQTPTPGSQNQSPAPEVPLATNQAPIAIFNFIPATSTINQEIMFDASSSTDEDGTITNYVWDFGDSNLASTSQATTSHSYSTSSTFLISLITIDDKGATSSPATTSITVVEEETEETSLLTVVINEIAWMGTATSSWDEWLEFYNNTDQDINMEGWTLKITDREILISSSTATTTTIPAKSFYFLERDEKATNIPADLVYGGQRMSNDGEKLELRDNSNVLIDLVDCSAGWFAGATTNAYIAMERISSTSTATSTNWASNNLISRNGLGADGNKVNGTPKSENSVAKTETQVASLPFTEFNEITLTYLGNPYIINNNLTVPEGKTLSIEAGVSLKFQQHRGLVINGTLLAQGEESNKINFVPLVESDHWSSIYFSSSSQGSVLDDCLIKNTGQNPDNLAIKIDSTSITLRDSKIENTTVQVLKLINSSSTIENLTIETNTTGKAIEILGGSPEIRDSTITDTYAGIFVEQGSQAVIEGNYFEGIDYPLGPLYVNGAQPVLKDNNGASNSLNGIYLMGTVSNDWTLYKNEIPYTIANLSVAADKTLKIKPGAVVQLIPLSGKIEVNGVLEAIGEENNEITFISSDPSSKWETIHFTSQSATSTLEYVSIKYGGKSSTQEKGALSVDNAKVEFRHLSFDGNYYSLYFENASSSVISDSEFTNCQRGILIEGGCPEMTSLNLNCTCNFASPSLSCSATTSSICQ